MTDEDRKKKLLACVRRAVADVFCYDRKDDAELTPDDVERLIDGGAVTLPDIVEAFRDAVRKSFTKFNRDRQ